MSGLDLVGAAAHLSTTAHLVGAAGARAAGLDPDPAQARQWVEQELAKDDYRDRRSLLQQLLDWLGRRFDDLQNPQGAGDLSFPPFVIAALAVLLVAVLVVLATRVRRERRVVSTATVLGDSTLTAAQLRARAAQALREGRHDDAVLDTVRAIAREADARTLLTDAPSLTAHEIGRQLSVVFPDHADAVTRAVDRFDAVAYGHLTASRRDADEVMATDEALRRARPALPQRPRWGNGTGGAEGSGGPGPTGEVGGPASVEDLRAPGPALAPGELVGTRRGSWASSSGSARRRGGPTDGTTATDDDPGSVWTAGGGS